MTAPAATDLAGLHRAKDASVGCIACHGGADPLMQAKVWVVAAVDTIKFLVGVYDEPTHMRLPLRDAECRQCHTPIVKPRPPTALGPAPSVPASPSVSSLEASYGADPETERPASTNYHAIRDHDTVNIRCVRCHTSHTAEGDEASLFLSPAVVRPICRECHKEMLGAVRPGVR